MNWQGRQRGFRAPRRRMNEDDRILPLINVVFLLLIFFMVTGRLTAADPFPIEPPQSASEGAPAQGHLIAIGADGQLALDGAIMEEAVLLDTLRATLSEAAGARIRIKADGGGEALELVALLARLRGIGAEEVTLMTVPGAL